MESILSILNEMHPLLDSVWDLGGWWLIAGWLAAAGIWGIVLLFSGGRGSPFHFR